MSVNLPKHDLDVGAAVGKYEVLRKLATGGMAEIYLARARGTAGFEKLVVLKRILPNVAVDPSFVEMFLDEARLAATLQHPNIADVYDVGESDGSYFFTMEFVHGEDARAVRIATRQAGTPVPQPIALAIVHNTAAALAYAHDKTGPDGPLGLVHRDVSTSNILISFDGAVKLVDFGIARASSRHTKTRTGTLKGKIPYMSPEQCQNLPLDRRSDLFSLGVVLFELTLGRRPFRGDSDFAILSAIVQKPAPRPSDIDPAYPPELERIVVKLLEREPAARYQNAHDLIADLEAFMAANQAWVSATSLGKYMRELFADKVAAWKSASQEGRSLGEHVAETITSESVRAVQRITPVSSFAAQALPVAPARSRKMWWIGAAVVALGAAGVVVATQWNGETSKPDPVVAPVAAPVPVAAPAPAPVPVPVAAPAPAPVAAPAPVPVAAPAPVAVPVPVAAPPPKPKPLASKPKPPPPAKPSPAPEPAKPDAKPQKDTKWDRNSLTLPK